MTPETVARLKKQLRKQIRLQRQSLSPAEKAQADTALAQQYQQHLAHKGFRKIAIYLHQDGEVGTSNLIQQLFDQGCQLYLPKLYSEQSSPLQFCSYQRDSKMENNCYGIPEPVDGELISINDLDLILLPLTAFDRRGHRLGMGGGYYDRALSRLSNRNTRIVGLAYDFQQQDECPVESFDQPLQMLLTPTGLLNFNQT